MWRTSFLVTQSISNTFTVADLYTSFPIIKHAIYIICCYTKSDIFYLSIWTQCLTDLTSASSHIVWHILPQYHHTVSQILKLPQQHHTKSHRYQLCIITQFHRSHTIIIHLELVRLLLNNVQESVRVKMSMLENIYSHDFSLCLGHMYLPM